MSCCTEALSADRTQAGLSVFAFLLAQNGRGTDFMQAWTDQI